MNKRIIDLTQSTNPQWNDKLLLHSISGDIAQQVGVWDLNACPVFANQTALDTFISTNTITVKQGSMFLLDDGTTRSLSIKTSAGTGFSTIALP